MRLLIRQPNCKNGYKVIEHFTFEHRGYTPNYCECIVFGKKPETSKGQPLSVWYKSDSEARGHYAVVCSRECGQKFIDLNNN